LVVLKKVLSLTKQITTLKLKIMKTLKNLDTITKTGLVIVSTIIIPLVTILINEIVIKGSTLHF